MKWCKEKNSEDFFHQKLPKKKRIMARLKILKWSYCFKTGFWLAVTFEISHIGLVKFTYSYDQLTKYLFEFTTLNTEPFVSGKFVRVLRIRHDADTWHLFLHLGRCSQLDGSFKRIPGRSHTYFVCSTASSSQQSFLEQTKVIKVVGNGHFWRNLGP